MNTISVKTIVRIAVIALVALGVPATWCQASVEPELTMAIGQKNVAKVQQLLAEGANVNERDEGAEQTPLMRAVQVKDAGLVRVLLAHGANMNIQDDFGKTALMFATAKEDTEIVKLLLGKGADVSLRDAKTLTAADIARANGRTSILKLLTHTPQVASTKVGKATTRPTNRAIVLR